MLLKAKRDFWVDLIDSNEFIIDSGHIICDYCATKEEQKL